jgi:homeobox protein cut-like
VRLVLLQDIKKSVAPMMKQFQSEIDSLTKRAKAAEGAFLSVYTKLLDAPDPVTILEGAVSDQKRSAATKELEIENKRLQSTIAEYHEEFAQVKNQDVTIKRLQDKLDEYEKSLDETIAGRVKDAERQLQSSFSQKQRDVEQEQLASLQQLGLAEADTDTMRAALEATNSELFDFKSKYDEDMASRAAETDMVSGDLERMTVRAATIERELENERTRMAELQNSPDSTPVEDSIEAMTVANLESEVAAKDRELSQVLADYREMQDTHAQLQATMDNRISGYDAALETRGSEIGTLQDQLKEFADYSTIKHELAVLKGIEFQSELATAGGAAKSFEALLTSKNRTLEAANTDLKREGNRLAARLKQCESDSGNASSTVQEQAKLIKQLEGDLTSVQTMQTSQGAAGAAAPITESVLTGESRQTEGSSDDANSLLPIVSSQRDRFRARNIEIEAENRQHQQIISSQKGELDTLRSDNVKLYEKIKFVQGYGGGSGRSGESGGGGGDDTSTRYSEGYEEHINPFKAFSAKEKQRKYSNLNPADKIAVALSRWIMSNPKARMIFVCYLLLLHFLIFFVTAHFSHQATADTSLSEQCMHKFAEHMSHIHDTGDHHIEENMFDVAT